MEIYEKNNSNMGIDCNFVVMKNNKLIELTIM